MSIYTGKGDRGETGLFSSDKYKKVHISKASNRIEVIGSIDEANTFLGIAIAFTKDRKLKNKIEDIQNHLFELGASLAGAKIKIDKSLVTKMEEEIDEMERILPKLTNFILPGGGKMGSLLFMARTFVRRAERRVVALSKKEKVSSDVIIYLNRLSDYVYTLARFSNFKEKVKETPWNLNGK